MKTETISQRENVIIRQTTLEPGEALPWHTDSCHRIQVIIRGDLLGIEFRDSGDIKKIAVHPGKVGWNKPRSEVHRGVNIGTVPFEDVVIFFLDEPGMEPQPRAS